MRTKISPTGKARCGGFTLVEVLIVLAIVGLLSGLAVPQIARTASRLKLSSATRGLLADLGRARELAVTGKKTVDVVIDPAKAGYAFNNRSYRLPVRLTVTREYTDTNNRDERPVLRFFTDGSASPMAFTLTNDEYKSTIRMNWLTGRAQVSDG